MNGDGKVTWQQEAERKEMMEQKTGVLTPTLSQTGHDLGQNTDVTESFPHLVPCR